MTHTKPMVRRGLLPALLVATALVPVRTLAMPIGGWCEPETLRTDCATYTVTIACVERVTYRPAGTSCGSGAGICDGRGTCCGITTNWTRRLPPIVATILYSPAGTGSFAETGITQGEAAGFRFQLSDSQGTALSLSVRNTTVGGGFSLGNVTSRSVAVFSTSSTGLGVNGRRDAANYEDDQYFLWLNPTLTKQTNQCDGSARYLVGVDDGIYADTCGAHTGLLIQQMLGKDIDATSAPGGSSACYRAIWSDVSAAKADILAADPFKSSPQPPLGSLDNGRFVRLSSVEAKASPAYTPFAGSLGGCAGSGSGVVADLSLTKYKTRRVLDLGNGETYSLDFQFMSSTKTCKAAYFDGELSTSPDCGTLSGKTLKADVYLDVVYGTLAILPTQLPQEDRRGACVF